MGLTSEFAFRVFMNHRDVTDWITSVELEHPRKTLYRRWTFRFAAWSAIESGAKWDLFASYQPTTNPQAEILTREGVAPPDREKDRLVVATGQLPRLEVRGYDFVWTAQRKRPRETIVLVPSSAYVVEETEDGRRVLRENSVTGALERYDGPVGKYRVWTNVRSVHIAIKRLANAAGMRVKCLFPDTPMIPLVLPPESSFWESIRELSGPWVPNYYYRDAENTLVIEDGISTRYPVSGSLTVPKDAVSRMTAAPVYLNRTRRVILKVPKCR